MNPFISGSSVVRRQPWSPEIFAALILDKNPWGTLNNSILELATLVLHETNTPTISCITLETSNIKPVVAYPLCICTLHSIQHLLNLQSFANQASRTVWQMRHIIFLIYMAPPLFHTCLPPTFSHKFCGNSSPCCSN